jgi:hypothetical protein
MDWLQFIADVIKSLVSLAWPAALVTAVWLFREKLTELMPLLRLKYKDIDVSFRLDQAEKEAEALSPPVPNDTPEPTPEETDKFNRLVRISPSSAIAEKSREVEAALAEFGSAIELKERQPLGWVGWTRILRKHELIDSATAGLLDDLRSVRNAAVHGGRTELSADDAYRFGALADKLITSLKQASLYSQNARDHING